MESEIVLRVPYKVFLVGNTVSRCLRREVVGVCVLMSSEGRCAGGEWERNDREILMVEGVWACWTVEENVVLFSTALERRSWGYGDKY